VSISEDNKRNARDVWTISSEPYAGEHFAPFPPALVKPMVLSGTSEVGCCSKCGAPWKREVERTATPKATTIDWSPSCSCGDAGLVPCTLLDPFAGVGTTALVANALGRKAVLIEANATYAAMAQERIDKELPEYTARANSTDAWGAVIVDGTGDISTTSNAERLIHLIDEIVTEQ